MTTIEISKLNKAEILATLYNHSKPQGMGLLHYTPNSMTIKEAQVLLDEGQTYFDYLKGRVMKIDLSTNELETDLYDRDNGYGVCALIIATLVKKEKE